MIKFNAKIFQLSAFYSSFLLFALFLIRLIDLQLVQGNNFQQAAEANRQFQFAVPASRGIFLDRYGDNLVYNTKQYYRYSDDKALFSRIQYLSDNDARQFMATASAYLSYDLARFYLYPESLAHILGYLAPVQKEDLAQNKSLLITDRVGKLALEAKFEPSLRGVKGKEIFEINTFGQKQRRLLYQPSKPGEIIQSTIDPYLSQVAFKALADKKGTVLILDAKNGEVLSLVNQPSFSSNDMSNLYVNLQKEKERKQKVSAYFNNPNQVFFNRAVSGAYPPGSVFKPITALAALESGGVDANTIVRDEGILKVGDFEYTNWYYTQYGRIEGDISLVRAIARSNDIYFYKAAEFAGVEAIAGMARNFGFGSTTGLNLPGEVKGLVPDPAWKELVKGERWYLGNTYHYGIGQGDILVTPLQMAQMMQAISNHASLCKPHLVKADTQDCIDLAIKQENLDLVLQGMVDACSNGGTAYPFFKHNALYRPESGNVREISNSGAVICKTGTAEFGGADERGYRKTHGWFIASVAVDKLLADQLAKIQVNEGSEENIALNRVESDFYYTWLQKIHQKGFPQKLIFVVLVESDEQNPYREGSHDAAPVIKQILDWMMGEVEG